MGVMIPDASIDGRSPSLPDLRAIRAAHARIAPHVHKTPVLSCAAIDREVGAQLLFKCENFQRIGAFKARGACNAVFSLGQSEAQTRGSQAEEPPTGSSGRRFAAPEDDGAGVADEHCA